MDNEELRRLQGSMKQRFDEKSREISGDVLSAEELERIAIDSIYESNLVLLMLHNARNNIPMY